MRSIAQTGKEAGDPMQWRYLLSAAIGMSLFLAVLVGSFVLEHRAMNASVASLAAEIDRKIEIAAYMGEGPFSVHNSADQVAAYTQSSANERPPLLQSLRRRDGNGRPIPLSYPNRKSASGSPSDEVSLAERLGDPANVAIAADPEEIAIAAQAKDASVVIEADSAFKYGETYQVRLILARNTDVVNSYAEKTKEPTVDQFMTAVTRQVRADISAPRTTIVARSPETQSVRTNEATTWLWDLTPTASGPTVLEITLLQTVIIDGEAFHFPARYFPYEIEVSYSWTYVTQSLLAILWSTFSAVVASLSALASIATFTLTSRLKRPSETLKG